MRIAPLIVSLLALALAYGAYQKSTSLELRLKPLVEAVAKVESASDYAQGKATHAKDSVGDALIELGKKMKGKN